jgi:signal transduction histidine kinase
MNREEILEAYRDYDRELTISNFKVACVLGMVMMPAGVALDYFVYREFLPDFFKLRLLSSALIGLFLGALLTRVGHRWYRSLGIILLLVPASFISYMIYRIDDRASGLVRHFFSASSPYYAGLNLVLLMLGFVLRWTFRESLGAVALTVALYITAVRWNGPVPAGEQGHFFNNLYFLTLTGIIVVTGNYFLSALRFREFALRYELDRNKQQLEETNKKLLELDRIKSRFFANISHELRTPLTLLLAPLESMLHRDERFADPETRDLLRTMHDNGMRLLKLINDLLDLVRLESGHMEVRPEPVDLPEFVRGLASAARQVAQERRIQLETTAPAGLATVAVDRDKLEKILLNLLFNALKFTPAGGRVDLAVERQDARLLLRVRDTGVGIAANHLPFVFDRFYQADTSSQRKHQGAGIGLALVKEMTELLGGSVAVESAEGEGTTFTVILPFREATPEALASRPSAVPSPAEETSGASASEQWLANLYRRAELFPAIAPLREAVPPVEPHTAGDQPVVLIADDEPDMLRFLKSQLSRHYQVIEAGDGREAVEKAIQFVPDIILLDMMMPEKDGLQACQELREGPGTQHIPVIILTARADEETKLSALSAGANDFLPKPFSTTELHLRVKNLVQAHQLQRELGRQNERLESVIEQLKGTEVQLVQAEKIASLGRMSAGIIHEINNPLNFAATGIFALKKQVQELPEGRRGDYSEILRDVEEGINRVKSIVSDLRAFTHPDTQRRDQVPLDSVVADALRFLSNEWKTTIRVETRLPREQVIWANRNRLLQLLLNFLQNAFDAVRRKAFTDDEPTVWIEGRIQAGRSLLVIRDNGDGIEAKDLDKIYEPFFTTKEVGEGMGLGLSICYRIIQEIHGQVHVRSERGKYSEFTLEFPMPASDSPG